MSHPHVKMYSYKQVILAIRTGESESLSENHPTERGKFMKLISKRADQLCVGDRVLIEPIKALAEGEPAERLFVGSTPVKEFFGGEFGLITELRLEGNDDIVATGWLSTGEFNFTTSIGNQRLILQPVSV